ncbi:MAG: PQQ-binding-like beta-propeller repeat protein, partial [bacterium]
MRKIIPILALIIFVVAISLAQLANSAWPVRGHDIQHTGRSPYVGPSTSALKWEFKTMMPVYSSPAIGSDGTIYVGSSGIGDKNVYAINPDGTQKWKFTTGDGVYCSPTLGVDGTIYVGSYDHNLYALNSDGSLKWTFTTGDSVYSCPAIGSDGTIYFGSEDQDKKVYALNPDGTLKWSFTTGFTVSSSPAISPNGTIYIGSCDNNVYALNPDGTQKWVFITRDAVTSSPAISTDGTIYVGSRDNNVYAINTDGTQKWSFTTGGPVASSPSIGTDGTIYIGSNDKNVYAINPDGTKKWFFITGGIVSSIPAIGADGIIYVGSEDKKTYALNTNGTQKWTFTTGGPVYSSPAIGADGILYIGSDDFKLYAIGKGITTNHTLTLTSPNGGEQFQVGSANPVTWTSTGNPGNVKIELFKGGILNNTISTNTSDTGSFNWNILATQATGTDYQVKISAVSDATITSQSAADFAITAGTNNNATISITSPNGSEQLTQGTTNPITWTSTGTPGNIKIELFKGGILNSTIAPNVANTGSYNWNIPATQTIGTDYQVKISAVTNNTINSQSAGDFEIIAGTPTATIFITSPLGSEQWLQNSTHPVTWSSTGNPGNVKIELLKNGVINSVIAAGIPDSGTYNWAIPQNQATGTDYQVRISAVANLQVTNQSAANFSILPGGNTPTLAAPALYLPANNSINVPIPTKFNWNAVLNAVSY